MARASDEQVESVNQSVTRDFSARPVNFSTFGIPSRLEHTVRRIAVARAKTTKTTSPWRFISKS